MSVNPPLQRECASTNVFNSLEKLSSTVVATQILLKNKFKLTDESPSGSCFDLLQDAAVDLNGQIDLLFKEVKVLSRTVKSALRYLDHQTYIFLKSILSNFHFLRNFFETSKDYNLFLLRALKFNNDGLDKISTINEIFNFALQNFSFLKSSAVVRSLLPFGVDHDLKNHLEFLWVKMSLEEKEELPLVLLKNEDIISYYWVKVLEKESNGNVDYLDYLKYLDYLERIICSHLSKKGYINVNDSDFVKNKILAVFLIYLYDGDAACVKKLYLEHLEIEDAFFILYNYLNHVKIALSDIMTNKSIISFEHVDQWGKKLTFLFSKVKTDDLLKIYNQYFEILLLIATIYWPWLEFQKTLINMWPENHEFENVIIIYDLILFALINIKVNKSNFNLIKITLEKLSFGFKKTFYEYISQEQKSRKILLFWEFMKTKVLHLFLKDDNELRNIFVQPSNYGLLACIYLKRYDLIELITANCLNSEEQKILFYQSFTVTDSGLILRTLNNYPLDSFSRVSQYLEWASIYEDYPNNVFEEKDKIIDEIFISMISRAIIDSPSEEIKSALKWMLNLRQNYEVQFLDWKRAVIEHLFSNYNEFLFNKNFKDSLSNFLIYGVKDFDEIKKIIKVADIIEGEFCFSRLKKDFYEINNFLNFILDHGKDVFLIIKNIFSYIFSNCNRTDILNDKFWENLRRLIFWFVENHPEITSEVEGIKKKVFLKCADQCLLMCALQPSSGDCPDTLEKKTAAINRFLIFFSENIKNNQEWINLLSEVKVRAISKMLESEFFSWNKKDHYLIIFYLINWGRENQKIKTKNWELKKYFMRDLKIYVDPLFIPTLVLDINIISNFFEGDLYLDENESDFKNTAWDFKNLLMSLLITNENHHLCKTVLENIQNFSDFLNWGSYDVIRITELKMKILEIKGPKCCLDWIENSQWFVISNFLSWCRTECLSYNIESYILLLKEEVLNIAHSKLSKINKRQNFEQLEKFLLLGCNSKEAKDIIRKKFAITMRQMFG